MREIKFRAWHEGRKVMLHDGDIFLEDHHPREWIRKIVEPLIVTNYGLLYWILETKLPNATDEHFDHRNLYNRGIKIMQYTGLKDKNSKEIYEGDLYRTEDGKDTGIIKYRGSGFYIDWLPPVTFGLRSDLYYVDGGEVIGNIHENGELLSVSND